jgi:tetratricopeptide (TPR) repeat protein
MSRIATFPRCSLILIIAFITLCGQLRAGRLDSLLHLLRSAPPDSTRADHYNDIGKIYWRSAKYDLSSAYTDSAMALSEKLGYKKGIASAWYNTGLIFQSQGNYPEAMKSYFRSLALREKLGDKQGMANSYNTIGVIYWFQKNYPEALRNLEISLDLKKAIGDEAGTASCYNNIGNVYSDQLKFEKALENYRMALAIKQRSNDKYSIANSYNNMGSAYVNLNRIPEALDYLHKSLRLREEISDQYGLAACHINIGNIYTKLKDPAKAGQHLKKALQLSLRTRSLDGLRGSYEGLSQMDALKKDYRSALRHYQLYIIYRDSLLNEENTRKSVQAQMQYDFDKKSAADSIKNAERLKQEELKHSQEIQQQKIYTYGGIIGFSLMLIVAGVAFHAYRQKQKANAIIHEQKILAEMKQKEIVDSIYYAQRIQKTLLPSESNIAKTLNRLNAY